MKPELLAPAGDMVSLHAAIQGGADAAYFGVEGFNMRERAKNFQQKDIRKAVALCHQNGVKAYLALNIIIYEEELGLVKSILESAKEGKVDAVILWDLACLRMARDLGIPIHLSTQASAANTLAVKEYADMGVSRVVLARECSLGQIKKIATDCGIETEAFCHGALCVAESGRCLTSQFLHGKSANRGECLQPCRRSYEIRDPEEGHTLILEGGFVMSPKDLCTMQFLDELIETGVTSLKIEGRNRKPEYVLAVTKAYREGIDLHSQGKLTPGLKKALLERLEKVYNRGFSSGFYLGAPTPDDYCGSYGSQSEVVKEYAGKVVNYFRKPMAAEILLQGSGLQVGDRIMVQGETTGVREMDVLRLERDGKAVDKAIKGGTIALFTGFTCRKNDLVYLLHARNAS